MKNTNYRYIYGLLALIYLVCTVVAYAFDIFFAKWILALPWSILTTFLSPLLAHMGEPFSEIDLIIGAILNFLICLKFTVFSYDDSGK